MNNVIRVIEIVMPIFVTIYLGIFARKNNKISEEASKGLQQFVMTFCLPCVLFNSCLTASFGMESITSMILVMPLIFLKYGAIAFGGGYVLVPVYIGDFVGKAAPFLQLSEREFADVMALTQMTPGPIAVNMATYIGYLRKRSLGSFFATLGVVLPSFIIILLISLVYEQFANNK